MKKSHKRSPATPTSTCSAGSNTRRASNGSGEEADRGARRDRARLISQSLSARRGGGGCRTRIAERDPNIRIVLRLPLHEAVSGLRPEQHVLVLVVEDEF